MTIEMLPISQPYPDTKPFLDVRGFLANGWTSTSAQTFAVKPDGNSLELMFRVRSDNAVSANIALGIPFAPPYAVTFPAYFGGELKWCVFNLDGRLAVFGGIPPAGELSGIIRMPMRASS